MAPSRHMFWFYQSLIQGTKWDYTYVFSEYIHKTLALS